MTKANTLYIQRNVNIISLNSLNNINTILDMSNFNIPNLVCTYENNNRITSMDFGSWCYTDRKIDRSNQKKITAYHVDINSFNPDRILGIKIFLEELLSKKITLTGIKSNFKKINIVISYLNEKFSGYDCSCKKDAEYIYIEYTKYLINKIMIKKSSAESVTTESYKALQEILAKFLAACTKKDINHFYSLIRRIESTRVIKPINKNEISQNINNKIKILLDIFNTISDHIINNYPLPCIIDLTPHNLNRIFIDVGLRNKSKEIFLDFFYHNKQIVTFDEFNKKIDIYYKDYPSPSRSRLKGHMRSLYHRKNDTINKLNLLDFKDCEPKILMANFCMVTFAKLLISVSGANESVLYDLKINSFKTISNEKGKRAFGIKVRAGGKTVAIEFGLKFQKVFDKYIKLREIINNLYSNNILQEHKLLLFIKLPIYRSSGYNKFMKLDCVSFDKFSDSYKILFNEPVITNKELRKNVANNFFNFTNNSITTSIKLGNSPQIANKSYANSSFEELAIQFTNYFQKLDETILMKGRLHSNLIPIKLESDISISTTIGNCSTKKPELIDGFNDINLPLLCENPKSCLYCDSFILHLNKVDIKKILSLKYILEYNSYIKNEQKRIIFRINEIIQFMKKNDSSIELLINEVCDEISEGYLDEYWNNHLNMLLDMESS